MKPTLRQRLRRARADKIPRGWMDANALAVAEGYEPLNGAGAFYYTIKRALAAGLIEARHFRVATGSGIRRRLHYRYR